MKPSGNLPQTGPELDEATATAMAIIIHNHIESLKVWERKLRQPFMPTTHRHLSYTPEYPKPTLATMMQIMVTMQHGRLDTLKLANKFLEQMKKERANEEF